LLAGHHNTMQKVLVRQGGRHFYIFWFALPYFPMIWSTCKLVETSLVYTFICSHVGTSWDSQLLVFLCSSICAHGVEGCEEGVPSGGDICKGRKGRWGALRWLWIDYELSVKFSHLNESCQLLFSEALTYQVTTTSSHYHTYFVSMSCIRFCWYWCIRGMQAHFVMHMLEKCLCWDCPSVCFELKFTGVYEPSKNNNATSYIRGKNRF
jgi:hypothetical protein